MFSSILGDVVVRVTFVLGNLAARSSKARIGIGMHCDTVSLLPLLLRHYLSDMLREGQRETMDSNTDEATQVLLSISLMANLHY